MSTEENKAIVRRWFEAHSAQEDVERAADELLSPDFVDHIPPFADLHGPEGYKQFSAGTFAAYPDARFITEELIGAEEDKVVVRWTLRGTHLGETRMGIAPTGKQVRASGMSIVRIRDGKVVEMWTNVDFLGLMQQMGAISPS